LSSESEIAALIALLDDNDKEVFENVSARLIALGPMVIEKLEDAYTTIPNTTLQERIEELIHHIQFTLVEKDLADWAQHDNNDLLRGVLIITRHQYPELDEEKLLKTISRIQKDIWIGINNYLSPLEQMNVVNQTLFSHYQFLPLSNDDDEMRYMYINNLVDAFKGNHFAIGILYLSLCQQLDLPVYGVCLSAHFILARTKDFINDFSDRANNRSDVLFYINPYNKGLVFSEKEINIYLKKIGAQPSDKYFAPSSNRQVLLEYVQYLINLIKKPADQYKVEDLRRLEEILIGD